MRMCYPKPGPRCSSHTLLERQKALLESRAASDDFQRSEQEALAGPRNPDGSFPEDVVASMIDKRAKVELAGRRLRRVTREWRSTRHGIETLNLDTAVAVGQVDPEALANVRQADKRVSAVLGQIVTIEAAGGKPSPALAAERKAAMKDYATATRDACAVWHSEVARTMNDNPARYFVTKPVKADDIDPTKPIHLTAMRETAERLRASATRGSRSLVRDPEKFRKASVNLQAAAAERSRRLGLFKSEGATAQIQTDDADGWEPMDDHHNWSESSEATMARQSHPDTHKYDTHGVSYGDHAESRNRTISLREKRRAEAREWVEQMESESKAGWDTATSAEPSATELSHMERMLAALRRDPELKSAV